MDKEKINLLYKLGVEKINQDKYEEALVFFSNVLEQNENIEEALRGKIQCLLYLGQANEVLIECEKYIERFGDNDFIYSCRGNIKYQLGDFCGAIKDYESVIKINPNDADAYNEIGRAYGELNEYQTAIKYYNKALEINPNLIWAYNNRAFAGYYCNTPTEELIKDYQAAIKADAQYACAKNNLVELLVLNKKYETALEYIPKTSNYTQMEILRGVAYYFTGKKDDAINCFLENYENIKSVRKIYEEQLEIINKYIIANSDNRYIIPRADELKDLIKSIEEIYQIIKSKASNFCDFCRKPLIKNLKYVQSNDCYICEECVNLSNEVLQEENCSKDYMAKYPNPELQEQYLLTCSFCGRTTEETEKLISCKNVFICNGCVGVCNKVLENNSDFKTEYRKAIDKISTSICQVNKTQFDLFKILKILLIAGVILLVIGAKFYKIYGHLIH